MFSALNFGLNSFHSFIHYRSFRVNQVSIKGLKVLRKKKKLGDKIYRALIKFLFISILD